MTVEVPIHARHGVIALAHVDAEDASLVLRYRWHRTPAGYATTRVPSPETSGQRQRTIYMHRLVLGLDYGDRRQADHINRDRLDNRRSNLRIVTAAQNSHNRASKPGSSSQYRGVAFDKRSGLWRAYVGQRTLGRFPDELDAARVAARFRLAHLTHSVEDLSLLDHVEEATA